MDRAVPEKGADILVTVMPGPQLSEAVEHSKALRARYRKASLAGEAVSAAGPAPRSWPSTEVALSAAGPPRPRRREGPHEVRSRQLLEVFVLPAAPNELGEEIRIATHVLEAGGEYRWTAGRFVDMAIFVDAGKVTPQRSDLDLTDLRTTYGIGVRFHTPRATVLRLELAHTQEGLGFVVAFRPFS